MHSDLDAMLARAQAARARYGKGTITNDVTVSCFINMVDNPDVPALAADVEALVERVRQYHYALYKIANLGVLANAPAFTNLARSVAYPEDGVLSAAHDMPDDWLLATAAPQPAASPATMDAGEGTT